MEGQSRQREHGSLGLCVGCGDPRVIQEAWKVRRELMGEVSGVQTWEHRRAWSYSTLKS